jgi:hypothetical protein
MKLYLTLHRKLLASVFYLSFCVAFFTTAEAQNVAVKTNLTYMGVAASPNASLELSLGKRTTLELAGGLNFWNRSENKSTKHWLMQPELRYWFCESFNGHFIGLHGHGSQYNIGGWNIPLGRLKSLKDHRYEGYLYGGGLSYGYQWMLSHRWNFELSLGGGYARIHYNKYPCITCGSKEDEGDYNYLGITKAAVSLVFMID